MSNYNKFLIHFFLTLSFFKGFCQENIEYMGVLKLNDSSMISYKLHLNNTKGLLTGYSVTDLGGDHETKSNIKGTYNSKTNELLFNEIDIVYTKSLVTKYDFCYVHFKGKTSDLNDKKRLKGKFEGKYNDGAKCIDGQINMIGMQKTVKKAQSLDKKIQRFKSKKDEPKNSVSLVKTLDTLNTNFLKANQNMYTFTKSKMVQLKIYDNGFEDGDITNVYVNGKLVLKNYSIKNKAKEINIPLVSKETIIVLESVSEGSQAPNTTQIEISDVVNTIKATTSLNKSNKTSITIVNRSL